MPNTHPDPPGRHVPVGDTRLHVDERGPADAPVLLYIHGGPGQGCFDFMAYQGDRLAQDLRLVGVDQRGVLFSDPLPEGATLSEDDLVDDFEALREMLGIERWTILGHSFGGRLALRYAARQPDAVSAVIFECPGWDHAYGLPYMLASALPALEELGKTDAAREARTMIADPPRIDHAAWQRRLEIIGALDGRRDELYLKRMDLLSLPDGPFPSGALPDELHARGSRQSDLVTRSASFSESLLPLLSRVRQPALLITGAGDPATSPTEIEHFREDVRQGRVELFEASGHFPQLEEPERYTDLVRTFVTDRSATAA
jgi:proline iminopeptidase